MSHKKALLLSGASWYKQPNVRAFELDIKRGKVVASCQTRKSVKVPFCVENLISQILTGRGLPKYLLVPYLEGLICIRLFERQFSWEW